MTHVLAKLSIKDVYNSTATTKKSEAYLSPVQAGVSSPFFFLVLCLSSYLFLIVTLICDDMF